MRPTGCRGCETRMGLEDGQRTHSDPCRDGCGVPRGGGVRRLALRARVSAAERGGGVVLSRASRTSSAARSRRSTPWVARPSGWPGRPRRRAAAPPPATRLIRSVTTRWCASSIGWVRKTMRSAVDGRAPGQEPGGGRRAARRGPRHGGPPARGGPCGRVQPARAHARDG